MASAKRLPRNEPLGSPHHQKNRGVRVIEMNPMFYATFAYLAFSSFFIIGGLWLAHGIKKDRRKREQIGFAASTESRPGSAE
jgi:hypothetical protein